MISSVLRHLSLVLGSRFDHAAEAVMPILLNLVPNSAKIMATSGIAAIRLILRVRDSAVQTSQVSSLCEEVDEN